MKGIFFLSHDYVIEIKKEEYKNNTKITIPMITKDNRIKNK